MPRQDPHALARLDEAGIHPPGAPAAAPLGWGTMALLLLNPARCLYHLCTPLWQGRSAPPAQPLWRQEEGKQRPALAAWLGDPRLHVFNVSSSQQPPSSSASSPPGVGSSQPLTDSWRLRLLDGTPPDAASPGLSSSGGGRQQQQPPATAIATFSTTSASVLLCDALRSPVLELDLTAVTAALDSRAPGVRSVSLGLTAGVWSYNAAVRGWEPVVEPWSQIAKLESNATPRVRVGRVASVQICVCMGGWEPVVEPWSHIARLESDAMLQLHL